MIEEKSLSSRVLSAFTYVVLGMVALACLLPIIHVVAVSFSSRAATTANLVTFWPINFTTLNYEQILKSGEFTRAFGISVTRVLLGLGINMTIVVLTAYPLSLARGFRGQSVFKWLLLVGYLFRVGLIPLYLVVRDLQLLNSIWALVLPGAVQVFYIIVLVNFFRGLPEELAEAATVDGASHWTILFRIYVPLSLPALATIALFVVVDHWNAWFDGLVFMLTPANYPLQTYLQTTIVAGDFSRLMVNPTLAAALSRRAIISAQIVLATIPILLIYPFVQRYFVTGLTLGSVKG